MFSGQVATKVIEQTILGLCILIVQEKGLPLDLSINIIRPGLQTLIMGILPLLRSNYESNISVVLLRADIWKALSCISTGCKKPRGNIYRQLPVFANRWWVMAIDGAIRSSLRSKTRPSSRRSEVCASFMNG